MKLSKRIRYNLNQIYAITEKNTKMAFRFKLNLVIGYFTPLIQLIFPFIIMGTLFSLQSNFGPWNQENYFIYLFIGYNVLQLQGIIGYITKQFRSEKYWLTLQALMVAPFNRFNLLFGYVIAHLISTSISLILFFVICFIIYPISFLTILLFLLFALLILLIFAGFGFIMGGLAISRENMTKIVGFVLGLFFTFSCITYPFQIFPYYIQYIVNLNPLYYIIDILRLTWIENDPTITLSSHLYHLIILFSMTGIIPLFGLFFFNYTYNKHGIVGY